MEEKHDEKRSGGEEADDKNDLTRNSQNGKPEQDHDTHNSGANTDSSDIEVIGDYEENNSSDSIEVIDGQDCALGRRDTVIECNDDTVGSDASETTDGDTEHVDLDQLQLGDHTPAQEAFLHSSDSAMLQSTNSCDAPPSDEQEATTPVSVKETGHKLLEKALSTEHSGYASDSSFSRGSPLAGSDVEHLLPTDNMSDSSGYTDDPHNASSPFGSPSHKPKDTENQLENGSGNRPDSLSLPRPLQYYERQRLSKKGSSSTLSSYSSRSSSIDALIEVASNTPLHNQGTVMKDGDMVAFVADGLQDLIKRSSPMTKSSGSQTPSARSISSMSSSTSGWSMSNSSVSGYSYSGMSRSPSIMNQSPEDIPPIDPKAVADLEAHAKKVSESLNHMMGTLNTNLHKMSSITNSCLDAYKDGIDSTCDSVDASIKSMYALMAKCEELSKTMRPIYPLHEQIKEIKRLLDLFEAQMAKDEK